MATLIVAIKKPVTVKDINNNNVVLEVADVDLNGICYVQSVNTSVKYYGHHLSAGRYEFYASAPDDLPIDDYKLYKDADTPLPSFHGTGGQGKGISDNTIPASAITSGTLDDARLSSNIPRKDGYNQFIGGAIFTTCPTSTQAPPIAAALTRKDYVDNSDTFLAGAIVDGDVAERAYANGAFLKKNDPHNIAHISTPVSFENDDPPSCTKPPVANSQLGNKGFIISEINARINALSEGNYQESPNVIRLIPDGIQESQKVYLSWSGALTNAISREPVEKKQFCIEICGEGTSGENVPMQYVAAAYLADFVHFRGLAAGVKVILPGSGNGTGEMKATAVGDIVLEDMNFYGDDGDMGSTGEFENIVFKNCNFNIRTSYAITFINCRFEGKNIFESYADNQFIFTNCTGARITVKKAVIVSGVNSVALDAADKFTIGNLELFHTGPAGNPGLNGITTITQGYGQNDGKVLTTPDGWLKITLGGNIYALPLFRAT